MSGEAADWLQVRLKIASVVVFVAGTLSCGGSPPAPVAPSPVPISSGAICGQERWAVKTLSDADSLRVDIVGFTSTTIAALNALTPHCSGLPATRGFPEEFRVYEVSGVVQLTRNEDDQDIHIALADPNDPTRTIVTEVVDPACAGAAQSPFLTMLTLAKNQYHSLGQLRGRTVRVRGVGFYDFNHGQTGRSASCIELHPVLSVTLQ